MEITPENFEDRVFYSNEEAEQLLKETFGEITNVGTDEAYDGKSTQEVFYFKDHDVYIGYNYTYSSWGDSDYDEDFYEVRPQSESRIVYAEVKKS